MSAQGGAFHIENSLTLYPSVLNKNEFRNCYTCHEGGSFTLVNSKLTDTASKYYQNAAVEGGVFKCDNCVITLTNSEIKNNDAYNGGMLQSENSVTMLATSTVVENNKAKN